MNDLLRGFVTPPDGLPLYGMTLANQKACSDGALVLGRLHLSGWDPTEIRSFQSGRAMFDGVNLSNCDMLVARGSAHTPTSHLSDVMQWTWPLDQ